MGAPARTRRTVSAASRNTGAVYTTQTPALPTADAWVESAKIGASANQPRKSAVGGMLVKTMRAARPIAPTIASETPAWLLATTMPAPRLITAALR